MAVKILIPLDGSDLSAQALPVARRLAQQVAGSTIELLYVFNPANLGEDISPTVFDNQMDWARGYLAAQADSIAAPTVEVTTSSLMGPPALLILEKITKDKFDYVVMATHGRSGLARAVIGSVTESVLRQSPVPVLVVSPKIGSALAADLTDESTPRLIDLFTRRDVLANDALTIIVRRGVETVPVLLGRLDADRPAMRQMAIRALGLICQPGTANQLVQALGDDDFEVRWEAAEALGHFDDHGVNETLGAIVHRRLDRRLAHSYQHVLDASGPDYHEAVRPVIRALDGAEFTLEAPIAAQKAMQMIESPSAP